PPARGRRCTPRPAWASPPSSSPPTRAPPAPPADPIPPHRPGDVMPRIPFAALPDDARLWVFGTGRELSEGERAELLDAVDRFLDQWRAHGAALTCAREWVDDRFLLVGVDPASEPPSGCSIDAMVNLLKELEGRL